MEIRDILPTLLATFTGPRYQVVVGRDFEWNSKCWVHDVFRVYELIFGSRLGLRISGVSNSITGEQYSYTWENLFAVWEGAIRASLTKLFHLKLPKVRLVYAPQLQLAGMAKGGVTPFRFAIGFDLADGVNPAFNPGSPTYTYSHTCTGSNLTFGNMGQTNNTGGVPVSTASYAGVTSTSAANLTVGNETMFLWYNAAPATGSNTVSVTGTGAMGFSGYASSYTGTAASPAGVTGTNSGTGTTASLAVTTTAANSWVIDSLVVNNGPAVTANGTNQTPRYTTTAAYNGTGATSSETTTTTGSYTMSWTWTGSQPWLIGVLEIKALPASGPTNVKTWDGVTQSTGIKTYFGVTLANTKSVDGVS